MRFNEQHSPKGHLEIWKRYADGSEELHYSDQNIITSGMGWTLSQFFTAPIQESVEKYQITYFQVGFSGGEELQVSSTGSLSAALTEPEYGNGYLDISVHDLWNNGVTTANQPFGVIPYQYIRKVSDEKVMFQIVLDQATANNDTEPLTEIGLFSKAPFHGSLTQDKSVLCAYRYFKPVYKTDAVTLVFRWTIEL